MKNLMMTFAMILVGGTAQASMVESYQANLTKFSFQKNSVLEVELSKSEVSGNVSVTPISDITVTIFRSYKCETGKMCPAIAYAPITYQVAMKDRHVGSCNEATFIGFVDQRAVDGTTTQITVVDNSHNICKTFVALPATQVTLQIDGANLHEVHTMVGDTMIEPL